MNVRWAAKRGLKWGFLWGSALTGIGAVYRRTSWFRHGYRILTYHRIAERAEDSFTVSTEHFRAHMAYLSEHAEVIELGELVRRVSEGQAPERLTVAVTFDDGYADLAGVVREVLEHQQVPATFFVVTAMLDREGHQPTGRFITWDQARELATAGFSIGSHTVTHRSLGSLSPQDVRQELAVSRERITHELGVAPLALSYPYGTVRDFSAEVTRAAYDAGYHYAVTAVNGLNRFGCSPFMLHRTSLTAGDGLRTFRMILKGNLDSWVIVDKVAYGFQRQYDGDWDSP